MAARQTYASGSVSWSTPTAWMWIRPSGAEYEVGPDVDILDASGTTIIPGMVDCHSHFTLPGGCALARAHG
jgi:adenine deaminase